MGTVADNEDNEDTFRTAGSDVVSRLRQAALALEDVFDSATDGEDTATETPVVSPFRRRMRRGTKAGPNGAGGATSGNDEELSTGALARLVQQSDEHQAARLADSEARQQALLGQLTAAMQTLAAATANNAAVNAGAAGAGAGAAAGAGAIAGGCLLYTSPSPRDKRQSRMPSSA